MQIGITGGSGRVGQVVVAQALAEGHSVVNIDQAPGPEQADVTFRSADIARYEELRDALAGCDALIHLAAIPSPVGHPDHAVHNLNVVGSYNALSAAAELGMRYVCQASSINATGAAYSRAVRWDYLPLDERHATYCEDGYSLSKWICEQQGDAVARRHPHMTIASVRFHWIVPDRATAAERGSALSAWLPKQLWGYTVVSEAARACLLALRAEYRGHEVFQIVAPDTMMDAPTQDLLREHFPGVPVRGEIVGTRGLYDCSKAERLLGWRHAAGS